MVGDSETFGVNRMKQAVKICTLRLCQLTNTADRLHQLLRYENMLRKKKPMIILQAMVTLM